MPGGRGETCSLNSRILSRYISHDRCETASLTFTYTLRVISLGFESLWSDVMSSVLDSMRNDMYITAENILISQEPLPNFDRSQRSTFRLRFDSNTRCRRERRLLVCASPI